jgi:hypothetical protein
VIDHCGVYGSNGPSHGAFADALGKHFAPLGFQHFTVIEPADPAIRRQNDSCGEHGPEEGAPAYLIHAGYRLETPGPQFLFQCRFAPDVSHESRARLVPFFMNTSKIRRIAWFHSVH